MGDHFAEFNSLVNSPRTQLAPVWHAGLARGWQARAPVTTMKAKSSAKSLQT
jgi:hypothetical protein